MIARSGRRPGLAALLQADDLGQAEPVGGWSRFRRAHDDPPLAERLERLEELVQIPGNREDGVHLRRR